MGEKEQLLAALGGWSRRLRWLEGAFSQEMSSIQGAIRAFDAPENAQAYAQARELLENLNSLKGKLREHLAESERSLQEALKHFWEEAEVRPGWLLANFNTVSARIDRSIYKVQVAAEALEEDHGRDPGSDMDVWRAINVWAGESVRDAGLRDEAINILLEQTLKVEMGDSSAEKVKEERRKEILVVVPPWVYMDEAQLNRDLFHTSRPEVYRMPEILTARLNWSGQTRLRDLEHLKLDNVSEKEVETLLVLYGSETYPNLTEALEGARALES